MKRILLIIVISMFVSCNMSVKPELLAPDLNDPEYNTELTDDAVKGLNVLD